MAKTKAAAAAATEKLVSTSAVKGAMLGIIGMTGLLVSAFGPFKLPFAETLAKTYYRQAVVGLVILVVAVTGLITAVVKLFDPNQFKDQMVRWVQERTQRDLVLEGDLTMRYFPRLALESGKASLSQRRSAREFASIEKASLTLAWLPLLRGKMHIHSAELEGLRAQIVRFKDGSTNVDDLARDFATLSPDTVDLERLTLSRSSVLWNDEQLWQRGSLNELQIELGRLADGVSSPLVASARVDAPVAGIDARLQLKGRLLFDALAGRIELARIDGQLEGKGLGIDNLMLQLKGDVTGMPRERVWSADNLVVSSTHKSGLAVIHGVITAPQLRFGEYRLSGASISVDGSVTHPDRTTSWAFKVPRFEWADGALRDTTLQAQLTLKSADARWLASWSSPLALTLQSDAMRLELAAVDMTASALHPALAAETALRLNGKIEVDLKQQRARAALAGKLADKDLRSELTMAGFAHPRWTLDIEAPRLDLDVLLSSAWLARWGDDATAFDASWLRDANAKGQLRVGQLSFGGLQATGATARFELEQSVLALEPLNAQLYGAQLEAVARIDASASPRLVAKGSLNEVELRGLLADLAPKPWLEGRGALTWDLTSEGGSIGALRNRLGGSMNLSVRGGAVHGLDLRAALLEGKSELGKRAAPALRGFNVAASTPFSEMRARIELREGRAFGQGLELQGPALRAAGEGQVQLDSGAIDLRLLASVGKGAPDLAALAGVSVPLQVHGPWRQPQFAFDFGAAAGDKVPRATDAANDVLSQEAASKSEPMPARERVPVALSTK